MGKLIILLLIVCSGHAFAQKYGVLLRPHEEVIIAFKLKNNNKFVVLSKSVNNSYIAYRFGTKDKIELQYPSLPGADSWKQFIYHGYHRDGGVENEALRDFWLSFTNNGVEYTLYEDWYSRDNSSHVGILVKTNKKETKLPGDVHTDEGTLQLLDDLENLIHNNAYDN